MKIKVTRKFLEEIAKNNFLKHKSLAYDEACKNGTVFQFFKDNPDFVQVMNHLLKSPEIKYIKDDEPGS